VGEFLNKKHCGNHFSFGVNWQTQIPHKSVTSADHLKQLVFFGVTWQRIFHSSLVDFSKILVPIIKPSGQELCKIGGCIARIFFLLWWREMMHQARYMSLVLGLLQYELHHLLAAGQ
jgi:hypothetical protein